MKIRTEEELQDQLDKYLVWRKKEITYLKVQLEKSKTDFEETINIRISITLLYAHLEGFIKEASYAYIYFLNGQKIKISEIEACFKGQRYFDIISKIFKSSENKFKDIIELINDQQNIEESRFSFSPEKTISTKSNLSSKVLKEIILRLGLSYNWFEVKEKLIDTSLLEKRNRIAHGEYYPLPSIEQTKTLFAEVIQILEQFKTEIENSVTCKKYLSKK